MMSENEVRVKTKKVWDEASADDTSETDDPWLRLLRQVAGSLYWYVMKLWNFNAGLNAC